VNVKRAIAAAAGALGALLLAAVIGLGHVAGPPASTPAQATLTAHIYGDSVNASGSHSSGRPSWGDSGSSSSSSGGDSSNYGDGSTSIYGDGSSSNYGDSDPSSTSASSSNYGDGTSGITADNYGD
jgi:hypothetical protein